MGSASATQSAAPLLPSSYVDDFYVPAYRLKLKGKTQNALVQDILSVTFHDSLKDIDSVDLQVNNWDPGTPIPGQAVQGCFRYHNQNTFDPWQDLELSMGYYCQGRDELKQMMIGEISSMAPSFPASGGSTLTVRALSFLHQFRTQQKTMQFKDRTDSQIAQHIVQDINKDAQKKIPNIKIQMLDSEVNANIANNGEKPWHFLEMHNQYPIVFLMQRSRDLGYDIAIDDSTDAGGLRTVTFHYRMSSAVLRPTYVMVWQQSPTRLPNVYVGSQTWAPLISFQPTLQTARQVNSVTVNGWDVHTKKAISKTATRADLLKSKNYRKTIAPEDLGVVENSLSQRMEVVVDRGLHNPEEANEIAKATLFGLAQGLVEAKGKTIGLPLLRAGSKIQICMNALDVNAAKPSDRFSGIYQVTETTHTFSESGYTTDFSCRMEAKTNSLQG